MFFWKQVRFYEYFNRDDKQDAQVLMKNEIVKYNDVLIARRIDEQTFVFAKLNNIGHFIELYNKCKHNEKSFYAVLTKNKRYLYLDIDYTLTNPMCMHEKRILIQRIQHLLESFNRQYGMRFNIQKYNER